MATTKTPEIELCPDWIYSDSSNVHVAKDRAWYTSYHAFTSYIASIYNIGPSSPVLGIGTIKLTVKCTPASFTSYGISTIELHNVLHVPDLVCNVLGRPLANTYQVHLGGSVYEGGPPLCGGLVLNGEQIAHFQSGPASFFSLTVLPPQGAVLGPSPFKGGASWAVSVYWPDTERRRWHAAQSGEAVGHDALQCESPCAACGMEFANKR